MTRNGIVGGDIAMRGLLKFQMLLYRPGKERRRNVSRSPLYACRNPDALVGQKHDVVPPDMDAVLQGAVA